MKKMIKFYTDGSARKNGLECGYGIVVLDNDELVITLGRQCANSTNNREELKAILGALMYADSHNMKNDAITIISDSSYCVSMFNDWMERWVNNNWCLVNTQKQVENLDLVKRIYELKHSGFTNLQMIRINGHADEPGNELADAIATNNAKKIVKYKQCFKFKGD